MRVSAVAVRIEMASGDARLTQRRRRPIVEGVTMRLMSIQAVGPRGQVQWALPAGEARAGSKSGSLTDVVARDANRHLCDVPRRLALEPNSLGLPLRRVLIRRLDALERLGDDAPHGLCDPRRVPLPHRVPQFRVLVQPRGGLVESQLGVGDLERDLVQDTEEEVGRLRVEGSGAAGRGRGDGD